jgi:Tol biopolymer transport system component
LTPDQWRQVWAAFQAITELPAADQARAIDGASDDAAVRRKLKEMVEGFARPAESDTIDPAAARAPDPVAFPLVGTSIGRFEVRGSLGRGGVGEVYRAYDTELEREVAIKCVSSSHIGSTNSITDFLREARAASALNHPGIVTVYEVIRFRDTVAIVMELVEGRPMRALTGAPHLIEEVALWGQRIAEALAATHAGGILHRDIKPENLIVRPDGYVKVLDFGLAAKPAVEAGELRAGTVRYMAPEQARGSTALTPATDIFSLGLVLYELATGVHPFGSAQRENTTLSVAAAVVRGGAKPPSTVVASLPPVFDALILQMLDKDPETRPTAKDVAERLRSIPPAKLRRRRLVIGLTAAACAVIALWSLQALLKPAAEPVELHGRLLTGAPGRENAPAFSPDGGSIVYAWDGGRGGKRDIWVKQLDSPDPRRLTSDPRDEWDPCWLPDGSAIVFLRAARAAYEAVTIPANGGPETVVTQISDVHPWLEHRLACADGGNLLIADEPLVRSADLNLSLYSISMSTRERRLLSDKPVNAADSWPRVSPDGRRIAFARVVSGFDVRVMDFAGGPSRSLANVASLRGLTWSADSQNILYQVGEADPKNVWQVPASGGAPRRPLILLEANAEEIVLSPGGRKIAYSRGARDVNLRRVFADGRAPVELAASTRVDNDGAWSPDGTRFAFASDRSGPTEIWVASSDGTRALQVTHLNHGSGSPSWSPDGQWLALDMSSAAGTRVGIVRVDGGPVRALPESTLAMVPSWSRDGKWIYFASSRTGNFEIFKAPVAAGPEIQITRKGGFESRESPDGRHVYFTKTNANGIWRLPVSGEGAEEQVAEFDYVSQFRCWDVTAQGIFIASSGPKPWIDLLPFGGGRIPVVTLPAELPKFNRCLSAHPDGKSFLFPVQEQDRWAIYLADNPVSK